VILAEYNERVDQEKKIELLNQQIADANDGNPEDFNLWKDKTSVVLRRVLGDSNPLYESFMTVKYHSSVLHSGMTNEDYRRYRVAGVKRAISILDAARLEVELSGGVPEAKGTPSVGSDIFIVHGRDDARKHEVARFLRALTAREPIILHEQANAGATLIEKFEKYASSTAYAVVIASADDFGGLAGSDEAKPRARQNVVFELGFFFGTLGRAKVALLYEDGIERPSDVDGIVYLPIDPTGSWKMLLAREIEAAGVGVDWKALRS
jgi:predicted nucleotide-binding protein